MKTNNNRRTFCITLVISLYFLLATAFAEERWKPLEGGENAYIYQERHFLQDIYFTDKNNGWIVGGGYGDERLILHTSDGGKTWQRQSQKGKWAQFSYAHRGVHFVDSQNGWIVGDQGIILHTSTGDAVWLKQGSGLEQVKIAGVGFPIDLFDVYFTDMNNGWAVGGFGTIIHTENGGLTWERQSSGTTEILWDIHCVNKNTCWAVGSRGTILHTTNGGKEWLGFSGGWKKQESNTGADLYGVHFVDKDYGWVVGAGGISHTSNGGKTWQTQARFNKTHLHKVFFINKNKGWAVGTDLNNRTGAIKYTEDGGKTWVSQQSGTIYDLTSVYFVDENIGFAVGEHGTILQYVKDNETNK